MKKIKFAFAVHDHQPIGNFEHVFEYAFTHSYSPFLDVLEKHPRFRVSLHFSGILLDWIKKHHPAALNRVKSMAEKGQVEMLTGAFYEPILAVIPDGDKIGQIQKLTGYIQKELGVEPCGMWLAERIWEPHLPKPLSQAGVKYTIVDDSHFKHSGLTDEQLLGYYLTEEDGSVVALFSSSKFLRYSIPFMEPEETVKYFRKIASEDGQNLIAYADDGEKFGVWPKTYEHCFKDRWIERFMDEIDKNSDFIEMVHLKEALAQLPPKGRAYLPTDSYQEMQQWALPPHAFREYEEFEHLLKEQRLLERFGPFVRGGFWRNFLAKYPESNNLHKKMLALSHGLSQLENKKGISQAKLDQARDFLWKGQCNCPYWHGVFGGLYLPHLRAAIYENLIQGEKLIDELTHRGKTWLDHQMIDFDADGRDELLVNTSIFGLGFSLCSGGSLFELDFKPGNVNLLDTITRREEGYHHKLLEKHKPQDSGQGQEAVSIHDQVLTKEEGLEKLLSYDWYRRGSLIDHFLGEATKLEDFSSCSYPEQGDFVNQPYMCKVEKEKTAAAFTLYRDGFVWVGDKRAPVTVAKKIALKPGSSELEISYLVVNNHSAKITVWFGIELGLAVPGHEDNRRFCYVKEDQVRNKEMVQMGNAARCSEFGLQDDYRKLDVNFKLDRQAQLWRFPIYTVSLSEEGFEKVQQSLVLFPNWKLCLEPQEKWEVAILNNFTLLK
jgi:hypothetical protein